MTQFIVFQHSPRSENSDTPDPEIVMAGLTESDSAQNAVHNLIAAGTLLQRRRRCPRRHLNDDVQRHHHRKGLDDRRVSRAVL